MKYTLYSNYYGWIDEEDVKQELIDCQRVESEEGITDEVMDYFEIGFYSPDVCHTIPHRSYKDGSLCGIRRRTFLKELLDKKMKYMPIEINNIVLHIDKSTYEKRISNRKKDAMEQVDEEIIDKRIDFYKDEEFLKNLNIGNIYQVNANNVSTNTVMQTLNHIHNILNK